MQDNVISRTMNLFTNLIWKLFISKNLSVKEAQETAETAIWLCELIFFSTGHFEGQTEVQLNSW